MEVDGAGRGFGGADGRGVGEGKGRRTAGIVVVVAVCLLFISSLHLAATLAALPGSAASKAAAAAKPAISPGLSLRAGPSRPFTGSRFGAACVTAGAVASGVDVWEGGGGVLATLEAALTALLT